MTERMEIEIDNLKKSYRGRLVLDIPALTMKKGELISLIGNNGSGKTTLLRSMMDLIKLDHGQVLSRGVNVSNSEHWKSYTAGYIDQSFLIEFLTAEEYFDFVAESVGVSTSDVQQLLASIKFFMNDEILGKKNYIRDFSAGNQQKIGIIAALISKPEILLLDEPFNFLDPSSRYFLCDYLAKINKLREITIVISSHNIENTLSISSRAILLEKGQKKLDLSLQNDLHRVELHQYFEKTRILENDIA